MSSSPTTISILIVDKSGTPQTATIPLADFHDSAKWSMSPISKTLGLPLKCHGSTTDLSAALAADGNTYANTFFLSYDPYSPTFGQPTRAPFMGDNVLFARCDGLPLNELVLTSIHSHITALTCNGECGSPLACAAHNISSEARKSSVAMACRKEVLSASFERVKAFMEMMPGMAAFENPLAAGASKEGAVEFCGGCGMSRKEDGGELMKCAKCGKEVYCGKECQKEEWKVHKKACKKSKA